MAPFGTGEKIALSHTLAIKDFQSFWNVGGPEGGGSPAGVAPQSAGPPTGGPQLPSSFTVTGGLKGPAGGMPPAAAASTKMPMTMSSPNGPNNAPQGSYFNPPQQPINMQQMAQAFDMSFGGGGGGGMLDANAHPFNPHHTLQSRPMPPGMGMPQGHTVGSLPPTFSPYGPPPHVRQPPQGFVPYPQARPGPGGFAPQQGPQMPQQGIAVPQQGPPFGWQQY